MEIVPPDKELTPQAWARALTEKGGDPFWAAPILSHGLLYVRGGKHLICYELIPPKK
jgi:hypothetical protein